MAVAVSKINMEGGVGKTIVASQLAHAATGLVLNEQSEYADNSEKQQAIKQVREVSNERGWRVFDYQIPYSRTYASAARLGTPLSQTPHARWDRIEGLRRLKNDILQAIGASAEG